EIIVHIYAFGSVCRGDIDLGSDVDMLVVANGKLGHINPSDYSIYSYDRIKELWEQGNPFAWHLHLESKLVFSQDSSNYLDDLGRPRDYADGESDCLKFYEIFKSACCSINESALSQVFDLSTVFLAMRNFASCYSLAYLECPDFSRRSSINLGAQSVPIDREVFSILESARILCTRGVGKNLTESQVTNAIESLPQIECWMKSLIRRNINHE
ncbi:nucleotidyltransferase domain-containing protein, partial [Photobacterium chitinilyticum]|uniref:nucleotidyltransferase domain-containing protein n=1 Tax=Photobacterium chitinilyticum TaxID=2485123 RepID=UPI003D1403A9